MVRGGAPGRETIELSDSGGCHPENWREEGNHCGRKANSMICEDHRNPSGPKDREDRRVVGLTYEYLARRLK